MIKTLDEISGRYKNKNCDDVISEFNRSVITPMAERISNLEQELADMKDANYHYFTLDIDFYTVTQRRSIILLKKLFEVDYITVKQVQQFFSLNNRQTAIDLMEFVDGLKDEVQMFKNSRGKWVLKLNKGSFGTRLPA